MNRILGNLNPGDAVIVSGKDFGPDRVVRKVRSVDYIAKVYKNVLQTSDGLYGVDIKTGRAVTSYGAVYVTPATAQDVADVLSEIEERNRADAEYEARQEAEYAARNRRERLAGDIRDILYRYVSESVLVRALGVLRGEGAKEGEPLSADAVDSIIDGMGWDLDLAEHADMRRLVRSAEAVILGASGKGGE